jgi:hypothetical protein
MNATTCSDDEERTIQGNISESIAKDEEKKLQ